MSQVRRFPEIEYEFEIKNAENNFTVYPNVVISRVIIVVSPGA